jgi:hypothetical protein
MSNLNDTNTILNSNINTNTNINNDVNNIYFFLDEKQDTEDNNDSENNINDEILKMLDEFNFDNYNECKYDYDYNDKFSSNEELYCELDYFIDKKCYHDDETYYNTEYNVKELIQICKYYDLDKVIKLSKCKKQDIITTIIFFEREIENYIIVQKRHKMWAFMTELKNDSKMKSYLLL